MCATACSPATAPDRRRPGQDRWNRCIAAYDDPTGVTAAFNLNLLGRINRELGGNFDLRAFEHQARYNERERRIEMHLRSTVDQDGFDPRGRPAP